MAAVMSRGYGALWSQGAGAVPSCPCPATHRLAAGSRFAVWGRAVGLPVAQENSYPAISRNACTCSSKVSRPSALNDIQVLGRFPT